MIERVPGARFLIDLMAAKSKYAAEEAGKSKSAAVATLKEIMQLLEKLPTGKK